MELLGRIFGHSKKPDLTPSASEPYLKKERKDYRPTVDDAGMLGQDASKKLVIGGSSGSLGIPHGNSNRPATLDILRKIAPDIEISEGRIS